MDAKQELFERFGKLFIERVRDRQIGYIDAFYEQKGPQKLKNTKMNCIPCRLNKLIWLKP